MKRLIVLVLVAGCLVMTAAAATNEVTSVNIVGYSKVTIPGSEGRILAAAGFDNLANGGTNTLLSIFGTNQLRAASNYGNADRVIVFDTAKTMYQAYAMWDGDRQFYPCNSASEWESSDPTNPVIPPGGGFWLVSPTSPVPNEITIMGQVITVATQEIGAVTGYQLLSYPFSCDIALQDINTNGMSAAANYGAATRIVVWEGSGYQTYALFTDGIWYKANNATEWEDSVVATNTIKLGQSVWLISTNAFVWSETNKYLGNL